MTADTPTTVPPVDWDAVEEEIDCPLCDYNLRGLIESRCPECGYRFEWPDMLDPTRRLHPYLYEHHPECGFKSFWRTARGGLRPRRFWRSLNPVQPSRPKRLMRYWCLVASILILVFVIEMGIATAEMIRDRKASHSFMVASITARYSQSHYSTLVKNYGSIQNYCESLYPTRPLVVIRDLFSQPGPFLIVGAILGVPLTWPWLSFLALMVFQMSMKRARIKAIHVLRCTLYASDVILWLAITHVVLILTVIVLLSTAGPGMRVMMATTVSFIAAAPLIASYRLAVAYRFYLRFDRPVLTVLAAQILMMLLGLNLLWAPWVWLH
ncbi:MAG: hypothetical protein ACE5EQ_09680 [Phycisphaerae bacterium]